MASLEFSGRQRYAVDLNYDPAELMIPSRDALPSINNFDFEKYRLDKAEQNRYSMPSLHSIAKSNMSSPPTTYSGPPPPYSSAVSLSNSTQSMSGYISPPESNSRRSTRDEKDPLIGTSLPSISEALKSAEVAPTSQPYSSTPAPGSAAVQSFADAPKGPGNPFSQPGAPASAMRSSFSSIIEQSPTKIVPPPPIPSETRQPPAISNIGSPRASAALHRLSGPSSSTNTPLDPPFRSAYSTESARPGYPFPDYHNPHTPTTPHSTSTFHFDHQRKLDDARNPFTKPDPLPYNETVKRHLDVYDAELALNEVSILLMFSGPSH